MHTTHFSFRILSLRYARVLENIIYARAYTHEHLNQLICMAAAKVLIATTEEIEWPNLLSIRLMVRWSKTTLVYLSLIPLWLYFVWTFLVVVNSLKGNKRLEKR